MDHYVIAIKRSEMMGNNKKAKFNCLRRQIAVEHYADYRSNILVLIVAHLPFLEIIAWTYKF